MQNIENELRDHFALVACQEMLRSCGKTNSDVYPVEMAKCAYSLAEAMMAERARTMPAPVAETHQATVNVVGAYSLARAVCARLREIDRILVTGNDCSAAWAYACLVDAIGEEIQRALPHFDLAAEMPGEPPSPGKPCDTE